VSRTPPGPNRRDTLVASAFMAWAMVEIAAGSVRGPLALNVAAGLLSTLPLGWRRTAPAAAGTVAATALALKTALGLPLDGSAMISALLVAAYSVGRHEPPRRATFTALVMVVLAWLSLFGLPSADQTLANYPFIALWVGAPALAGGALRRQLARVELLAVQAARAEVQREEHARLAVQHERLRIARELHDTVAHAVSVMVLHTGAVGSRLPDELGSEKDALEKAGDTGRQAIIELRRLLGVLRTSRDTAPLEPQPTLAGLEGLVEDARATGLVVHLAVEGERRALDPAVEVSAFRILQEALTNVRKHARASTVSVRVRYDGEWLRLSVADDGVGATRDGAAGYGLLGIRERVEVYGGRLSLSAPPAGGYAVDVALPVRRP
jgi:signal transduction histidine kinase